jgi:ectoine hydroxylase-related dioxygenase (phytanoyl-CoA dioxygenase family)
MSARTGSADALRQALQTDGYVVLKDAVPDDLLQAALRRLNLEILRCGITAEQIDEWKYATFWPTLRFEPEILALREPLAKILEPGDDEVWGDAQLLLRFPDEADEWPLTPHTDDLPEWADGREYQAIVGVALSRARAIDGCLAVWPRSHRGETSDETELVELDPGDIVVMHPQLRHSSTLNRGGSIRYAVYIRLLGAPPA